MPNVSESAMLPEPQQRNIAILLLFMIVSLGISFFLSKTLEELLSILITSLTIFVGIELLNRLCYFFDELIKIKVEYGGNLIRVLEASFSFNIPSAVIVIGSIIFFMILIYLNTEKVSCSFCTVSNGGLLNLDKRYVIGFFFALAFSFFLIDMVDIRECRAQKIETLSRLGGLDYGSSMACSFFYGYLKIILPADGKENQGLVGRIGNFEDEQKCTVPVKKLFILIPASFYIPPNLKEISNNWLEPIPERLEFVTLDRAGVTRRVYRNTVYKIHPDGDGSGKTPLYVVTEGATPLTTFHEVQLYKHRYSDVYSEYKREILKAFYTTLQQLLNDNPDCRDVCELVYYEDYDKNGKPVNPGEILLRRIQEESSQ